MNSKAIPANKPADKKVTSDQVTSADYRVELTDERIIDLVENEMELLWSNGGRDMDRVLRAFLTIVRGLTYAEDDALREGLAGKVEEMLFSHTGQSEHDITRFIRQGTSY